MKDAEQFYINVQRICEKRGCKIGEVSVQAWVHRAALACASNQGAKLTIDRVRAFSRVLDVPMTELMEDMLE